MQRVGTGLGGVVEHAVGRAAEFGGVGGGLNLEFLHGFGADHAHLRVVAAFAHRFAAVDEEAGAVGLAARDTRRAAGGVGVALQVHRDAGGETGESQVAAQAAIDEERQLLNGFVVHHRTQVAAVGLQQREWWIPPGSFPALRRAASLSETCRSIDLHNHIGRFRLTETFLLSDHIVATGRERQERVRAFCIGLYRGVLTRRRICQRHLRRRYNRPSGVGHLPRDRPDDLAHTPTRYTATR